MRCPQCGTENPPGKIVCRNCGTRLRPGAAAVLLGPISEAELMTRVRTDMRRLLLVVGVVVTVGIVLGFLIR